MLPFSIELKSGLPVAEQILFAVKRAVVTGQLRPGDPFPSVRVTCVPVPVPLVDPTPVTLMVVIPFLYARRLTRPGVAGWRTAPEEAIVVSRMSSAEPRKAEKADR